ncbi:glycosyltransferase family 2 protein [Rubellimicrobium rubrum]|uniref:Glycosyltransferase family 2 protein n=1 Tax=Rubellimicrobium rubrum TaxID=2585369 RepID=A0A5C4N1N5_9RHOB|nr:glycosyltransferase [Rubellimicrobium rubrum]TNC50847.1 glycosyltransferase family 2 protein [Rubellimicrobium rubrum]
MLGHAAYLLSMIALAAAVGRRTADELGTLLIVVGVLGLWRYSWAAINFARAAIYLRWAYPRQRAEAERAYRARPIPAHAFFLVTTYKIEPGITTRVYRSIFEAAAVSKGGATIVASVVDGADLRIIRELFARMQGSASHVKLVIDQIPGTGKRDAIARSLRIIAREAPSPRDVLIFVDGDSCVPLDIVDRSAPFFTDPRVGALTTDETVEILDAPLFRDWFDLRFMQRQVMMCSMALSGRVLTLTGRMSVVRADLATQPSFISHVQHDFIDHWRLGRVNFLTGDDKSTWFWLLSRGFHMTYLPDVKSVSMETQPLPGFFESAFALMKRWFGNMMRTNGRAVALGPQRIGLFTWWSVLDQRVSVWTTLTGPCAVLLTTILVDPVALPAYIAWVMFTRYVFCAALSLFRRPGFPIIYVPLLYFSQVAGALVKSSVMFRLDQQKWTRQGSGSGRAPRTLGQRVRAASSNYVQLLAYGWFGLGVLLLSGIL